MTLDLDSLLSMDPEELEQESARDNRPTWNKDPIVWEGDFQKGLIAAQDVNEKTGQVFPRMGAVFKNCHFVNSGHGAGLYKEGDDHVLLLRNPAEEMAENAKIRKQMTQVGRSTQASGADLTTFMGSRVRVTELAREWKTTEGYTRQSYYYKFERVGAANGATPQTMRPEIIADALTFIAGGQYTETNVGLALMKELGTESREAAGKLRATAFENGKFGDGSFIRDALAEGRLKKTTEGILHT